MAEPSVLDYLKAKLTPWRGPAPEIPPLPTGGTRKKIQTAKTALAGRKASKAKGKPGGAQAPGVAFDWTALPWRTPLIFLLFLVAQILWIPPNGSWQLCVPVALIALALTYWAAQRDDWRLPQLAEEEQEKAAITIRPRPFILGMLFFVLAFYDSGENLFTPRNVTLWFAAIFMSLGAFWQTEKDLASWWKEFRTFVQRRDWNLKLSRWSLILIASFALVAFFRLFQLAEVPIEMVSDHAEKLLDVQDILNGQTSIFFPRNTGREPLQFYLTAAIAQWLGTGLSFISLKIGMVVIGLLSLIYMYLLGHEYGGRWVGLLAMLLAGMAYWPNVLARTGLRFILYPAFVAPTLYYLLRGLRRGKVNDFLLSGLFLGVGLYGYTAFRIVPLILLVALGLHLLHQKKNSQWRQAIAAFSLLIMLALVVFTPLLRYSLEESGSFNYRVLTRIGNLESPLPGPALQIFFDNVWTGLKMLVHSAGNIWLVGLIRKPALDLISGTLFLIGAALILFRYYKQRRWQDLFLLLSVPLLMLPSTLSLAFPAENPALNRAGGTMVAVFVICAVALDSLLHGIKDKIGARWGLAAAWGLGGLILGLVAVLNYGLVFRQYSGAYAQHSWNSSELGEIIHDYSNSFGTDDSAWVVAYPHWVDTRLVATNAGFPGRDYGIWPDQLEDTLATPSPKLFLVNLQDAEGLETLQSLYPGGVSSLHSSSIPAKDFLIFFVPPNE